MYHKWLGNARNSVSVIITRTKGFEAMRAFDAKENNGDVGLVDSKPSMPSPETSVLSGDTGDPVPPLPVVEDGTEFHRAGEGRGILGPA